MIRTPLAALALVLGLGLASGPALAAGQISQEALDADRQACVSTCTAKGQTAANCAGYCDCTVTGIDNDLTLDEYRTLSDAANKKEPAPEATIAKLRVITNSCRAQMPQ